MHNFHQRESPRSSVQHISLLKHMAHKSNNQWMSIGWVRVLHNNFYSWTGAYPKPLTSATLTLLAWYVYCTVNEYLMKSAITRSATAWDSQPLKSGFVWGTKNKWVDNVESSIPNSLYQSKLLETFKTREVSFHKLVLIGAIYRYLCFAFDIIVAPHKLLSFFKN